MKQDCLFITILLSFTVFCTCFVFGQEIVADTPPVAVSLPETVPADAAVMPADTGKGAVRVERLPQDVVVLTDKETGRRMYTLPNSWTPEFIDSISRYIMRDQRSTEPTFVIHEVDAVGTVEGNKAKVVFKFRMTTRNEPIVRVPLGIKEGVVLLPDNVVQNNTNGQSSYMEASGEDEIDLVVDTNQGEYVALIRHSERQLATVTDNNKTDNNTNNASAPFVNRSRRELPCELKLTLWFPIVTVGKDEYRLNISFPKAVRSQFQLTVPEANAVPSVSTGTILLPQAPESKDETANTQKGTTFNLRGLKNDFYVSWQSRKTVQIEETTVLSVEDASLLVRLNEDRIDYEAMLPVRCHTGMLDRFRVKLPPGVQLIQDESATTLSRSYVISRVVPTDNATGTDTSNATNTVAETPANKEVAAPPNEIEVRLLDKNSTTLNLPLRAVKTVRSENPNDLQEDLVGFEVVGADKQSGFLSLEIPADRQLVWRAIRGITRSEPSDVLSSRQNETQFSFFSQPFLLRVQAKKPQTQINVRPEYVVFINKDRVELTAMFQYTIHGSRAEKLQISMYGWNNPEVTPYSTIDITNIQRDGGSDDILTIPLLDYTESSFTLTLTATLPMSPDLLANHRIPLRFELPTPIADSRSVASVAIVAADCIQLFPRDPLPPKTSVSDNTLSTATAPARVEEETIEPENVSVGLSKSVRRSHQFHIDIPQLQQAPLFYQKTAPVSAFSADVLYHKQQVKVTNTSEIQLLEPSDQVTQTLRYTILYERLDNLYFYVPKKMNDETQWRVYLDNNFDKPLTTYTVPIESDSRYSNDYVKKRIALDRIGSCQLTIRYGIEQIDTERDFSLQVSIPFVIPANVGDENNGSNSAANVTDKTGDDTEIESRVYQQTVSVIAKKGFELTLNRQPLSSWESDPNQRYIQGGPQYYQFGSTQSEPEIRLLVSQAGRDVLGTTVIERAWIQSQLSTAARADCVTCQLTSNRDSIMLHVPTLVTKEQLLVRINDVMVMPQLFPSGELVVPLASEHQGIPLVMEVWYTMPFDNSSLPYKLDLPYFDSSVMVRCIYWQLLVPRNIHLLSVPSGWTPEYQWNWEGLFWGRYPSIDQQEIGLRSGATQPLRLPVDTNRYLFSTLERRNEGTLYMLNRGTLVLFGSGISLLVGLILIYVPKSRYAGSLLALAVTAVAVVLYRPTPFLLLLQASILGVLLALAVSYFDRLIRRQDRWMPYTDKQLSSVSSKREQQVNIAVEADESNDDGREVENE